jgi:hypothetical protein
LTDERTNSLTSETESQNQAVARGIEPCRHGSSGTGAPGNVGRLAGFLAAGFGAETIIDLGAGSVGDLIAIPGFRKIGIISEDKIESYRRRFPQVKWISGDWEKGVVPDLDDDLIGRSIVICANVIQKLSDPTNLMPILTRLASQALAVIVTTPTKGLAGVGCEHRPDECDIGPGKWTIDEFRELLGRHGLVPTFLGVTASSPESRARRTILAIFDACALENGRSGPDGFHPLAIVGTYNDDDIAIQTIFKLLDDGIDVHVLDNWSTDGTYEQLSVLASLHHGLRIERFPETGPTETHEWDVMLRRKEEIAAGHPGRWIIHHDSDEVRCSPWAGISFRGGIHVVERMGFTAIDFTVCEFRPVHDRFSAGLDPERSIHHFELRTCIDHFHQVKAWRQGKDRVDLTGTGGHHAHFPGRRVFPYKFILKHYSLRHPAQARRKVFVERLGRYTPRLRAQRWHVQYDALRTDDRFLWNASELLEFDEKATRHDLLTELISGIGIDV